MEAPAAVVFVGVSFGNGRVVSTRAWLDIKDLVKGTLGGGGKVSGYGVVVCGRGAGSVWVLRSFQHFSSLFSFHN